MRQTSFTAVTVRAIACSLFHQLAPPATTPATEAKAIAVDLTDAGIVGRAEAMALGGFTSDREWNQAARKRRLWRKGRAS